MPKSRPNASSRSRPRFSPATSSHSGCTKKARACDVPVCGSVDQRALTRLVTTTATRYFVGIRFSVTPYSHISGAPRALRGRHCGFLPASEPLHSPWKLLATYEQEPKLASRLLALGHEPRFL